MQKLSCFRRTSGLIVLSGLLSFPLFTGSCKSAVKTADPYQTTWVSWKITFKADVSPEKKFAFISALQSALLQTIQKNDSLRPAFSTVIFETQLKPSVLDHTLVADEVIIIVTGKAERSVPPKKIPPPPPPSRIIEENNIPGFDVQSIEPTLQGGMVE